MELSEVKVTETKAMSVADLINIDCLTGPIDGVDVLLIPLVYSRSRPPFGQKHRQGKKKDKDQRASNGAANNNLVALVTIPILIFIALKSIWGHGLMMTWTSLIDNFRLVVVVSLTFSIPFETTFFLQLTSMLADSDASSALFPTSFW